MENYIKVRPIYRELSLACPGAMAMQTWCSMMVDGHCDSVSCTHVMLCVRAAVTGLGRWRGGIASWYETVWCRVSTHKGQRRKGSGLFPVARLWSTFCALPESPALFCRKITSWKQKKKKHEGVLKHYSDFMMWRILQRFASNLHLTTFLHLFSQLGCISTKGDGVCCTCACANSRSQIYKCNCEVKHFICIAGHLSIIL